MPSAVLYLILVASSSVGSKITQHTSLPSDGNIGQIVHSATAENISQLNFLRAPSWTDDAGYRGTGTLIWSCIFTVFASIYTAMRPNISTSTKSSQTRATAKFFRTILTLFAPEPVLAAAIEQFYSAFFLKITLNDFLKRAESSPRKKRPYTLTECFFVLMGGIEVAAERRGRKAFLTTRGAVMLAQRGHFINIKQEKIFELTKTSFLQGPLVLLQILWTVTQCVHRLAMGLHITLLEIFTLIQVLNAIIIYSFWYYKPADIYVPISLTAENLEEMNRERFVEYLDETAVSTRPESWVTYDGSFYNFVRLLPDEKYSTETWKTKLMSEKYLSLHRACILLNISVTSIYLAASNYPFVSETELIMWKAAAIYLVAIWASITVLQKDRKFTGRLSRVTEFLANRVERLGIMSALKAERWLDELWLVIAISVVLLALLSRVFLLVESFISLRQLSVGAYVLPPWLQAIPHV